LDQHLECRMYFVIEIAIHAVAMQDIAPETQHARNQRQAVLASSV
jgi:hypothetical protein